ncbi:MAG: glycosyltransferase [Bacillota bacterium]|nr:MAG: glycosyltransferase [Bacillota bacterium]
MPTDPIWLVWSLAAAGILLLAVGLARALVHALSRDGGGVPVSFLLVVRDCEDTLEGALRQLARDYGAWPGSEPVCEVVVVDQDSRDDTPAILGRLAADYPGFIRVVRTTGEGGCPATQAGLAVRRGRTVVVLDHEFLALRPGSGYTKGYGWMTEKQDRNRASRVRAGVSRGIDREPRPARSNEHEV